MNIRQNAEKKCPILSSLPEKLATLPGMKDFRPMMFDLKINSTIISITTITKIIDHILYNLLISSFLKLRSNCLKDKIEPIIKINFKTLGKVK